MYRKLVNEWEGALHQRIHKVFLCLHYVLEAIPSFTRLEKHSRAKQSLSLLSVSDIPKIYSYPTQTVRYVASVFELEASILSLRLFQVPDFVSGWDLYLQQLPPLLHFPQSGNSGRVGKAGALVYFEQVPNLNARNAAPGIAMILCFPSQVRLTHPYIVPLSNTKLFCLGIINPFYLLRRSLLYRRSLL